MVVVLTKKIKMNLNWRFLLGEEKRAWYKGFNDEHWRTVQLPHDWSIEAPFSKEHSSGTGYLPGGTGWYRKSFQLHEDINLVFPRVELSNRLRANNYAQTIHTDLLSPIHTSHADELSATERKARNTTVRAQRKPEIEKARLRSR